MPRWGRPCGPHGMSLPSASARSFVAWEARHAGGQDSQAPTKAAQDATCRGLPPREGDSPRPPRAPHYVAASEQNRLPCETFIEVFSSNSEGIIIKFYSHPFSISWEKKREREKSGERHGGLSACRHSPWRFDLWSLSEAGRVSSARNLVLFQSDSLSPSTPPPKKNQNVLHETIVYEALISRN